MDVTIRALARTDNKGSAELRIEELNSNSTRYDYLLAAPSDEELTRYWTAWAVVSTLGGSFVALILMGVLSSRDVRQRAFNLYLIYLMVPDAVYSILCGMVCMSHAINKRQVAGLCNFQMMFIVWSVSANMWLNAAVSHQLHCMLRGSKIRKRYQLPTKAFVTKQTLAIYVFTIFFGTWGLIESDNFPHYVASASGLACLPVEHDWKSSIFFWVAFFPLFGGIPMLYVHYVIYDVWKNKLLPPPGKRRLLVIYFGRIVIVFVLMWVPYMVLAFMFATWMPHEVHFYGGTFSHLQGAVSAALCLLKPDIYFAVKRFWTCSKSSEGSAQISELNDRNSGQGSSSGRFGFHLRPLRSATSRILKEDGGDAGSGNEANSAGVPDEQPDSALDDSIWPDESGNYPSSSEATSVEENEDEAHHGLRPDEHGECSSTDDPTGV